MPSPQFNHVIETVNQLESSIDHMKNKWNLFYLQGYLPETDVFDKMDKKVQALKDDLYQNKTNYLKIFNKEIPQYKLTIKKNQDGSNTYLLGELDSSLKELLLKGNLTRDQIGKLKETDIMLKMGTLNNIKDNLYYRVEAISDMLNALNYGFTSRVSGIFSPETTFAKDIATKKFGGIQLVYDATEALMKDYVQSFVNEKYNGLVVFGFRNRAVSYPTSIVVFPAYSEHDLEFLTILAHESFHFIHSSVESKIETKKNHHFPLYEHEKKLLNIKHELKQILRWLAEIYSPEDYIDKKIHWKIVTEALAHEFMADIYATFIAGESYPLMLYNYFLPIILNVESGHISKYDYSSFTAGSLKLRISLLTLEKLYDSHGYDINQLKFSIRKKNIKNIDDLYREIKEWEDLSINLTRLQKGDDDTVMHIMKNDDRIKISITEEIESICDQIEHTNIIDNMGMLIKRPFYPDNITFEEFDKKILDVYRIFKENPTHKEIFDIWNDDAWFRPKHLISILAKYPSINRNAILMSLAYHKNTTSRFR
ncbi:Uncharacterised protein [uncultured archaeon]|nr:Uncharacterised protein [uncultured archaeon]